MTVEQDGGERDHDAGRRQRQEKPAAPAHDDPPTTPSTSIG